MNQRGKKKGEYRQSSALSRVPHDAAGGIERHRRATLPTATAATIAAAAIAANERPANERLRPVCGRCRLSTRGLTLGDASGSGAVGAGRGFGEVPFGCSVTGAASWSDVGGSCAGAKVADVDGEMVGTDPVSLNSLTRALKTGRSVDLHETAVLGEIEAPLAFCDTRCTALMSNCSRSDAGRSAATSATNASRDPALMSITLSDWGSCNKRTGLEPEFADDDERVDDAPPGTPLGAPKMGVPLFCASGVDGCEGVDVDSLRRGCGAVTAAAGAVGAVVIELPSTPIMFPCPMPPPKNGSRSCLSQTTQSAKLSFVVGGKNPIWPFVELLSAPALGDVGAGGICTSTRFIGSFTTTNGSGSDDSEALAKSTAAVCIADRGMTTSTDLSSVGATTLSSCSASGDVANGRPPGPSRRPFGDGGGLVDVEGTGAISCRLRIHVIDVNGRMSFIAVVNVGDDGSCGPLPAPPSTSWSEYAVSIACANSCVSGAMTQRTTLRLRKPISAVLLTLFQ